MPHTHNQLDEFLSLVPVQDFNEHYREEIDEKTFFGFPLESIIRAEKNLQNTGQKSIGYFSMEYGLSSNTYNVFTQKKPVSQKNYSTEHRLFSNLRAMDYYLSLKTGHQLDMPIYSGGLGVLAGDTLKSAADHALSLVAVGILWHKGYFKQNFWFKDGQVPEETDWDPGSYPGLIPLKTRVKIPLKNETIHLKLWKYFVYSFDKQHVVPLILLDSNLDENKEFTRKLTGQLYRSDNETWRLLQRTILGLGGMKAFEALEYTIDRFHLNEGHAALAFIEKAKKTQSKDMEKLKEQFAYTCHTPVAAGHDRFSKKLVQDTLLEEDSNWLKKLGGDTQYPDVINLTQLAMNTSKFVNAVAQKHGQVTRAQFPQYKDKIKSITNGVHIPTWVSGPIAGLLDQCKEKIGDWRKDHRALQKVSDLKNDSGFRSALWEAHQTNKIELCALLKSWRFDPNVFTICWARRIAAYKRPSMILQNISRLLEVAKHAGPIQILLAGKAHPKDDMGFTFVNDILTAIDSLEKNRDLVRVVMLENYDTYFGKLLSRGVDVWLNNPLPPFEASGTSGMKAILNGVLQLSTLDGWMVEAADKNIGWIFGWEHTTKEIGNEQNLRLPEDAKKLYESLEKIVPLYYATNQNGKHDPSSEWISMMINAVSQASFFSTSRMVEEYKSKIWAA